MGDRYMLDTGHYRSRFAHDPEQDSGDRVKLREVRALPCRDVCEALDRRRADRAGAEGRTAACAEAPG